MLADTCVPPREYRKFLWPVKIGRIAPSRPQSLWRPRRHVRSARLSGTLRAARPRRLARQGGRQTRDHAAFLIARDQQRREALPSAQRLPGRDLVADVISRKSGDIARPDEYPADRTVLQQQPQLGGIAIADNDVTPQPFQLDWIGREHLGPLPLETALAHQQHEDGHDGAQHQVGVERLLGAELDGEEAQRDGAEIVSYETQLLPDESWSRAAGGTVSASIDGHTEAVNYTRAMNRRANRVIWHWYWVGGEFTASPLVAKLLQGRAAILGGTQAAAYIAIAADYEEQPADAHTALAAFIKDFDSLAPLLERAARR